MYRASLKLSTRLSIGACSSCLQRKGGGTQGIFFFNGPMAPVCSRHNPLCNSKDMTGASKSMKMQHSLTPLCPECMRLPPSPTVTHPLYSLPRTDASKPGEPLNKGTKEAPHGYQSPPDAFLIHCPAQHVKRHARGTRMWPLPPGEGG